MKKKFTKLEIEKARLNYAKKVGSLKPNIKASNETLGQRLDRISKNYGSSKYYKKKRR